MFWGVGTVLFPDMGASFVQFVKSHQLYLLYVSFSKYYILYFLNKKFKKKIRYRATEVA